MKSRDIKEFIRVMLASILTFVHRMEEMVRNLLLGIRAFGASIVRAVKRSVSGAIRNLEVLARRIGRGIRRVGGFLAGYLRIVYGVLKAFSDRLRVQARRLTSWIHRRIDRLRERWRHLYYSKLLPLYHHLIGFLRFVKRRVIIAFETFKETMRSMAQITKRAFLKVWSSAVTLIRNGFERIRGIVVGVFTKMALFFGVIARSFTRIGLGIKWGIEQFLTRSKRAFGRCGPTYYAFFFLAVGGYWYIFINTYHRIIALIFSFLIYHFTFDVLILPIFVSIIVWINSYHPILALVRRSGRAFARVSFSIYSFILYAKWRITRRILRAIARSRYSLGIFGAMVIGLMSRLFMRPLRFAANLLKFGAGRIRNGWISVYVSLWLLSARLWVRTIRAMVKIKDIIVAAMRTLASAFWKGTLWAAQGIWHGALISYQALVSGVRRARLAVLAVLISLALGIKFTYRSIIAIGQLILALAIAILLKAIAGVKRIARSIWNALVWAGRAITNALMAVGKAVVRVAKAIWVKIILVVGMITAAMVMIGQAVAAGLRVIGRAGLAAGRMMKAAIVFIGHQVRLGILFLIKNVIAAGKFVWMVITTIIAIIVGIAERIGRAMRAVYWRSLFLVKAGVSLVWSVVTKVGRAVNHMLVWTGTTIYNAFVRITISIGIAIWIPVKRTGLAFSRTTIAIITGIVFVVILFGTGLYVTLIKISIPILNFLGRNILAWQRLMYTIQVLSVKLAVGMWMIAVRTWQLLVTSVVASVKWIVGTVKLHYRGIREISLIFAPSIAGFIVYLAIGSLLALGLAISYVIGITSLSYAYNRYKGEDLNV